MYAVSPSRSTGFGEDEGRRTLTLNLLDVQFWHWLAFAALVGVLLLLDLAVFHRRVESPSLGESFAWTIFWIVLALAFNGFVWWWGYMLHRTHDAGVIFLTGYVVEKSLSMDNLFVFALIFKFFQVKLKYQYRVLFWGVFGAVVLRLVFILAGVELIRRFEWVLWFFGAFLVYSGIKLLGSEDEEVDPERNVVLRAARKLFRVARDDHGHHFFGRENGQLVVTPLFLVLLVVESTDVLFAVDSVPAILAITQDSFIVFTSNIFAILGLRALYFVLAGIMDRFQYLHYGLSGVLVFIGVKMIVECMSKEGLVGQWAHIPNWVSLSIIMTLLTFSILASMIASRHTGAKERASNEPASPEESATKATEP
jgi:tellurite resistance protein TerC